MPTPKPSRASLLPLVLCAALVAVLSLANAPAGRYTIANGTVRDTRTGLTWQQSATIVGDWTTVQTSCSQLALDGGGWRLPTIKELRTILDLSQGGAPFIDRVAFPSTPSGAFWSFTSYKPDAPNRAWSLDFGFYYGTQTVTTKSTSLRARCVR